MTYNVDLMLQVRDQITMHPETYDQSLWSGVNECGTTACIAGWAVKLLGKEIDYFGFIVDELPTTSHVRYVAEDALNLNVSEAHYLFDGDQTNAEGLQTLDRFIEAGKNGQKVEV